MSLRRSAKFAFWFYNLVWGLVIPFLRFNHRLAEGFEQRTLKLLPPKRVDLWIQAASVGESLLAWELLKRLKPEHPLQVLLTSNTAQGIEILQRAIDELKTGNSDLRVQTAFFPFDKPAIMQTAVRRIDTRVMVLLETEIWPGHLEALKAHGSRILIINGRLTRRSLKQYQVWPSVWRTLRPHKILAVSEADADRFAALFGSDGVATMPNIKFDRVDAGADHSDTTSREIKNLLPPDAPFVTLGSIRRQEEAAIGNIIQAVMRVHKNTVIALFPRHAHRIRHWRSFLNRRQIPWQLRSSIQTPIARGSIILWDTFGELSDAYRLSTAAFVGGSLAPLGGQNFLEAQISGVIPVIGPSWENFAWVGTDILASGLLKVAGDWQETADQIIKDIDNPVSHQEVIERADRYLKARQGGTELACQHIIEFLRETY
jgi:3-deoxy-D-manno-octulosonic-acid transferase